MQSKKRDRLALYTGRALEIEPGNEHILINYGCLIEDVADNVETSREIYRKIASMHPHSAVSHMLNCPVQYPALRTVQHQLVHFILSTKRQHRSVNIIHAQGSLVRLARTHRVRAEWKQAHKVLAVSQPWRRAPESVLLFFGPRAAVSVA